MKKVKSSFPLILLFLLWGFTAVHYKDLPTEIPIHFNAKGMPDGFATRIHCWGLPLFASLLYFGLNFPLKRLGIKENEKKVLFWTQGIIMGIFCYIQYQSFLVALERSQGLGVWFLPLTFLVLLLPVFVGIRQKKIRTIPPRSIAYISLLGSNLEVEETHFAGYV